MTKELGETSDPTELVPGSPDSVMATMRSMRSYGDALHEAGTGLTRIDVTDGWSGQAGDAIQQWHAGQAATARSTLDNARSQLNNAGDTANSVVGAARDKAPEKPGFWSKVGDFFEDAGASIANFTGTVVNAVASDINAIAHHPEDVAGMFLGALGVVGGGAGLVASVGMDASGVLTAPGLAAGVGSLGLIGVGGAAMVGGARDLGMHASSDDRVSPMRTDHTGSGGDGFEPNEGFRGSQFSKDELIDGMPGHMDDGNPTLDPRPTRSQIEAALDKGTPKPPVNQQDPNSRQEQFDYQGVRVT